MKNPLGQAWEDWISQGEPYDWFATFTFRQDRYGRQVRDWVRKQKKYQVQEAINALFKPHPPVLVDRQEAKKMFARWCGRLKASLGGAKIGYALRIEKHQSGAIHLHALIKGKELSEKDRQTWEDKWVNDLGGGKAEVLLARQGSAANYITKYIKPLADETEIEVWGLVPART